MAGVLGLGPCSVRHALLLELPWDPLKSELANRGCWSPEPLKFFVTPMFRSFKKEIQASPLAQRRWAFEERALAARMVHFGSNLTFWECKEACIGEDYEMKTFNVQDGFYNLKDFLVTQLPPLNPSKLHDK